MPTTVWDLRTIFERSPILTSELVRLVRPDDTPEMVIRRAREIVSAFAEPELVATLEAHPRIGDDVRALSELSLREQGSDRDAPTIAHLARLNEEYERRFGFRFVVFVNGRSKAEILPVLRERLERTRQSELRTGIEEFLAISFDRLRRLTDDDDMRKAMDVDS
jgi:2-oxo-4-hydroxy-4-carboxy--5-ureidoimidazoline (OHCU) decarboxylase